MNGPRPSTFAFLCDLPYLPADSKIRVLGCVRQYNVIEGQLILEHNYPRKRPEPSIVAVEIHAVIEDITAEELSVGSWLNVLGYVRDSITSTASFSSSQQTVNSISARVPPRPVYLEAVMVFPAGAIQLGEYERIIRNAQDIERRLR
ncbi:hypothetical protein N7495_001630 [Penicillium taxi]|uniref:uncharacterized protein n=1 Tax=Penicillium taxi TaxID=168475 RepID=UPI002544D884|nr:uncharacterized protein N7495_001630 [Penicillium taxi]KAJ5908948.1 hypothetical protein N7495_001630 [Penicillium taxi]